MSHVGTKPTWPAWSAMSVHRGKAEVAWKRRHFRLCAGFRTPVENPENHIPAFARAGANSISVHYEACRHLDAVLGVIRSEGLMAGVVLNPATPVEALEDILEVADYVLLMSVNPGFGGQKLIPYVLDKVRRLDRMRREKKLALPIEIDGGVHLQNLAEVVRAGCDWIVTGSAVFHSPDAEATVREMREIAANATAVQC